MSYELSGKVVKVGNTEQKSDKLAIRELVVETSRDANGRTFTEQVPVQFRNAGCDKLNGISAGDNVKVKFELGGREYNGRYFVSVNGWAVDKVSGASQSEEDPF